MLVKEKVQKHKVNETIYQLYHVHYKSYLSFALPDPEALPVCAGASCFLGTGTEEREVILFRHCTKREKVELSRRVNMYALFTHRWGRGIGKART